MVGIFFPFVVYQLQVGVDEISWFVARIEIFQMVANLVPDDLLQFENVFVDLAMREIGPDCFTKVQTLEAFSHEQIHARDGRIELRRRIFETFGANHFPHDIIQDNHEIVTDFNNFRLNHTVYNVSDFFFKLRL